MHLGFDYNKKGTRRSIHKCESCGTIFKVIPAIPITKSKDWDECMTPDCESYDPSRDADKLFGEDGKLKYPNKVRIVPRP